MRQPATAECLRDLARLQRPGLRYLVPRCPLPGQRVRLNPGGGGDDDESDDQQDQGDRLHPLRQPESSLKYIDELEDSPGDREVSDEDLYDARALDACPEVVGAHGRKDKVDRQVQQFPWTVGRVVRPPS